MKMPGIGFPRGLRGALTTVLAGAMLTGTLVAAGASAAWASPASPATHGYYLALGDSLAAGYQPGIPLPSNPFDGFAGGYVADIASARHLAPLDLGCPGETTASFDATPALAVCAAAYHQLDGAASQQSAAVTFLDQHPGQVKLVTIDIGADNILGCLSATSINVACADAGAGAVAAQLPGELAVLRAAVARNDPRAKFLAMNYYDPALAAALTGNYPLAFESLAVTTGFNAELAGTYARAGIRVADVAGAFKTYSLFPFRPVSVGTSTRWVPNDVYQICTLTHMCAPAPNVHPNDAGYAHIARAFERVVH